MEDKKPNSSAYIKAIIALQKDLKNPKNTEKGYQDRYRYASLDKILDEVKPVLHKHGFIIQQNLINDKVQTILLHEAGASQSEISLYDFQGDAQKLGSYITYMRRYSILTILGLFGEGEDDDGQVTVGSKVVKKQTGSVEILAEGELNGVAYQKKKGVSKTGKAFEGWFPANKDEGQPYWNDESFVLAGGNTEKLPF